MDLNFAELKKEAAATNEDIFQRAQKVYEDSGLGGDAGNVSGGAQDDNAHTEHYFANEQKNLDFGEPQEYVQRLSAGAKEAALDLDAKFAQKTDDFDDFLRNAGKEVKQGISGLTTDFMNAERGFAAPLAPFSEAAAPKAPAAAAPSVPAPAAPAPAPPSVPAPAPVEEDLLGSFSDQPSAPLQAFQPTAPSKANFYDDEDEDEDEEEEEDFLGKPVPAAPLTKANQDSDTESPSVSYTPSPAKKPIVDALKEQDNEKFISSEDLLSDFKEEPRSAPAPISISTPAPAPAAAAPAPVAPVAKPQPVPVAVPVTTALVTDLDDDEVVFKPSVQEAPKAAAPVPEPKPEPPKPKEEPPKPKVVPLPVAVESSSPPQPKIVSVEEIFYKYGLDAWFKPERLHPQVESLIYWRDVKKSGIVFGAGLITLVAISSFSVISVFAYLSLLALFGTVAFRIYKSVTQAVQKTNEGHPFKEYLELDLTLSQDKVQNIAGVAVAHINGFTSELRRLFLVEDIIDSIKFGVILWVFTYVGAWFNGMTLVILAFVSLFTLPKVYENNKQSIDTYLDLVRSKLTEITDKIRVAIPIGNKKPVVAAESDKDK
ncbi:reticulon-1 isoform X1 [Drosophila subpulchrella]|uniref:reticulon-1 isoform X1 n=1 Tax=Drosophila subpulchrella TaxID=1486046 RepID=UPI0018A128D3|nr:reticulon-1 isoform X1 [Drosophila subpulchrella]